MQFLYGIGPGRLSGQVADTLRNMAYQLEAGVLPTRSQRDRMVLELASKPQSQSWRSYEVRLWYYICAAQIMDPRLAPGLLRAAKGEFEHHLSVWAFISVATSCRSSGVLQIDGIETELTIEEALKEANALGRERCRVFDFFVDLLVNGSSLADPLVDDITILNSIDLEFLLLAFGRNQLGFADSKKERILTDFIRKEAINFSSPVVSEYAFWSARMRKIKLNVQHDFIDKHVHRDQPRVRSAFYRLIGSGSERSRKHNWDYLGDIQKFEDDKCRFEIFSTLSSKIGTYDNISNNSDKEQIQSFVKWHSEEHDERCADRQFSFLLANMDEEYVQDYLIEEIFSANRERTESYVTQIMQNRSLPSRFLEEMKSAGVLSTGYQLDLPNFGDLVHGDQRRYERRDIPRTDLVSIARRESMEEVVQRNFQMADLETIVIATANRREARAVITELRERSEALAFQVSTVTDDIIPYNEGRLRGKNGIFRTIVVRSDDTGPLDATDLLRRILDNFSAKMIFFVGCAALLDEKQTAEPGTVFVARRAIDVDKREEGEGGADYDMESASGDARILRNVDAIIDGGHLDEINLVTNRYFLSGSAFVGNRSSAARKAYVKQFPQDAVVLEMEAFAVLKAVQNRRLEGEDVSVAVMKGVSDFGDENAQIGKDESQMRATRNSMYVVCKLLELS